MKRPIGRPRRPSWVSSGDIGWFYIEQGGLAVYMQDGRTGRITKCVLSWRQIAAARAAATGEGS